MGRKQQLWFAPSGEYVVPFGGDLLEGYLGIEFVELLAQRRQPAVLESRGGVDSAEFFRPVEEPVSTARMIDLGGSRRGGHVVSGL